MTITMTDTTTEVIRVCPVCQKPNSVTVQTSDYTDWRGGKLIQRAFPYLSKAQREILITGICGPCFDAVMGVPDEE